jgi:hypothetical protein
VAAEDITQEAFLSIWRSRHRYRRDRGSVRTWVLGIVHHRAIDSLRRSLVHERRRGGGEGIEEREEVAELTEVEAVRREELWVVRGEEVIPSSLMTVARDGSGTTAIPEGVDDADAVLVTRERIGGARAPSEEPVMRIELG